MVAADTQSLAAPGGFLTRMEHISIFRAMFAWI
jgi:hypothetical protein